MKAIVYDFDKTVYSKETSVEFMKFYISKHPKYILKFIFNLIKILFNIKDLTKVKNIFFDILKDKNIELDIENFWKIHKKYIYEYFWEEIKENKKNAEVLILISASPDFLLDKIYKELGFDILIATKYENFLMVSKNCKYEEKVNRLNELGDFEIDTFYSDSMSDMPLFEISKNKFTIVKGKKIQGLAFKKKKLIDKWI